MIFKRKAGYFGTIKGGMQRSETRRCPRPCSAQGRDAGPTVKGIRAWTAREHNFRNCWLSRPCPSDAGRGECRGVMTAWNFCGRRADDADARESWRYGKPKANSRRGLKFQTLRNAVICQSRSNGAVFFAAIHLKVILYNTLANCNPEIVEKGDFSKITKITR